MAIKGMGSLQAKLKNISKSYASNKQVRAGFLEGATYPDDTRGAASSTGDDGAASSTGTPVALVAAVHEFGAPAKGIPVRSFMRTAIAQNNGKWAEQLARGIEATGNVEGALGLVGEEMASDIRNSIRDEEFTELKPATVNRKGFATPLIDTAHMVHSVDHEVTER